MRNSVISVVVPCFNAGGTLGATIQSALAQQGVEFDLTVVDDGSTDGSLTIARSFEPAIRVLSGPNRGVSAARNRGIAETRGEWIVFLDADDLLLPGTLKQRIDMANSTDADVVLCGWQERIDGENETTDKPARWVDMHALRQDNDIACATHVWATTAALMYRRSIVEGIGGFREDLPIIQDARLLFDAAYLGAEFAHSPHIGARYRVTPHSLSRQNPLRFWRDVLRNGQQIELLWRARGTLSSKQRAALSQIYNGAAYALFRLRDPLFRDALDALSVSALPINWRNRLAAGMSSVAGHHSAAGIAEIWTKRRCILSRAGRPSSMFR